MDGQRRIDRILDPGYLDGLRELPTEEIRRRRDECEEEESGVSFARRVLQGRLDILRAEVLRRRDAGQPELDTVLAALPDILGADHSSSHPAQARATRFLVPPTVRYHRRDVDQILDEESVAGLQTRPVDELREIVERLASKERELSDRRRALLDRIDALRDELLRRYKSGEAHVADVLAGG